MLITERGGQLRMIRDGVLDPTPLAGIPKVQHLRNAGLFDVVLHPKFAENKLVYFTYTKPGQNNQFATALARGRLDDGALKDVKDLFVGEPTTVIGGSRIAFARDGLIYMTTGAATGTLAQDPMSDYGKVLRLRDDGIHPQRQSLHRPPRIQAGDLHAGPSRPTRTLHPSRNRRRLHQRKRPQRRRRDQSDSARPQLRLAACQLRTHLRRPAPRGLALPAKASPSLWLCGCRRSRSPA